MTNQLKSMKLTGTTDASGDLTVTATRALFGWLIAVQWIDGDLADGVDATLKAVNTPSGVDTTLLTLTDANDDAWYYPTVVEHDAAGAAQTTRTFQIIEGTLQLTVADGGDKKTGGCIVYFTDD